MVYTETAACGEWFSRATKPYALKAVTNHESRCKTCAKIKEQA